tara:strand:- start:702 stop:1001 length:300 start_codon:yes stop_codon:yes gene_type:complete
MAENFFHLGIKALGSNNFSVIVDLACGDGEFLSRMHAVYPRASIVASDISPIAIESTTNNLLSKYPEICSQQFCYGWESSSSIKKTRVIPSLSYVIALR